MTQDHSSKLSFPIEESVWLNKGQQVDEIVSLSLDPEITVEESGEFVLIRGGLKLTGEYRSNGKKDVEATDEESLSLSNQVAFRSIQEVTLNEDGTGEIKHYFPIDVTIPQERIHSLDDIYVIVESFDYDLPEKGCIQLTADVAITGMSTSRSGGGEVDESSEEADDLVSEEVVSENEEDRTFHYEAYNEREEDVQVDLDELTIVEEESSEEGRIEEVVSYEADEEEFATEEIAQVVSVQEDKTPTVAFGVIKSQPKQKAVVEEEETLTSSDELPISKLKGLAGERSKQVAPSAVTNENSQRKKQQPEKRAKVKETEEVSVELQEAKTDKAETPEAKQPRDENALYLTKMLTKGEEEEFKKLKMCIIQEKETLNEIAARYQVNEGTLIHVNQLNDSNLEQGQILFIPVTQ